MKVIIVTAIPLDVPSASLTRVVEVGKLITSAGSRALLLGSATTPTASRNILFDSLETVAYQGAATLRRTWALARLRRNEAIAFYKREFDGLLKTYKPDLVIVYTGAASLFEIIARICGKVNTPVLCDCVEYFPAQFRYILNGVWKEQKTLFEQSIRSASGIIGISRYWEPWAAQRGLPSFWLPPICSGAPPSYPRCSGAKEINILFLGRWVAREQPIILLKAVEDLVVRGLNVQLNVIGEIGQSIWEYRALRYLRASRLLTRVVRIHGYVDEEKKRQLTREATLSVILRQENRESLALFPTRLPELLLQGVPVILSNLSTFREILAEERAAIFVDSETSAGNLADAIVLADQDRRSLSEIGDRGRIVASRLFTPEAYIQPFNHFLETVVLLRSRHRPYTAR